MDSVGAGAARGLQAGWQMGMQADQAARQREQDALNRAQQDRMFGLQQDAATRAEQRLQHETERQDAADQYKLLTDQLKDITTQSASLQQAGQGVPPELATRYQDVTGALRTHRERAMAPLLAAKKQDDDRYWAGVQAGQIDPTTTPSGEFYSRFSRAIGMTPAGLAKAAQGAQLVQQGFDAGNQQLMLQGVNQLVERDLRAGEGGPSPHGGVITRKEVVGLLPVKDANGVEHPDKVFPVIRTYVMHPEGGGQEDYYDAPLTQNRTGDPNDPVRALDLNHAFDYMGRVGAMAQLLQHPDLQRKLAEGEQETGAQTQRDVETINALGRAHLAEAAKGAVAQRVQAILTSMPPGEERDKAIRIALGTEAAPKPPAAGVQRERMNLEQVDAAEKAGEITPEQAAKERKDIRLGARGRIAEPPPPKPAATAKGAKAAGMGTGAGGLSPQYSNDKDYAKTVDTWAEVLAKGGDLPAGLARANKGLFSDIMARAPQLASGATGIMADKAEYGGAKAGSRVAGQRAANLGIAKTEAYEMADLVTEASAKVPRTSFMPINSVINAYEKNTGDTDTRAFGAALNSFINAYARAVSPVGTPTVSDKNHAREMLSIADSHDAVVAIIGQLKKEMDAAERAPAKVRAAQGAAVRGMGIQPVAPMTGSGAPGAPTKPLPPGVKFLGFE